MAVVSISREVSIKQFQICARCQGENAIQALEIVNGVYGADTVTANYMEFWFRRFHYGIFDVKDAPRAGMPVVENIDKTTEIIEVDRHVSSRSIVQELKSSFKPFAQSWIQKEARYLGATPIIKKTWNEFPSAKPWPNGIKSTHFLSGR
ncbi:histone-lysine N-methyltransferase SETMAR [Trichonephila clavipes]|nr:histone-lysine N-methyltransferase SETMAR [Trichonephila clavipes]